MYGFLIKYAKTNLSHSLLELLKWFDWLTRRQLSIANWTSAELALSSRFQGRAVAFKSKSMPIKFAFLIVWSGFKGRSEVASPEECGCIVTHENLYFSNRNYERRSSKLADENTKCWAVFERSYNYLRLSPACRKTTRTSVKVVKTRLFPLVELRSSTGASFQLSTCRVSDDTKCWGSLRWDDRESLLSKRALLHCK